jgi:hypothetical protein
MIIGGFRSFADGAAGLEAAWGDTGKLGEALLGLSARVK